MPDNWDQNTSAVLMEVKQYQAHGTEDQPDTQPGLSCRLGCLALTQIITDVQEEIDQGQHCKECWHKMFGHCSVTSLFECHQP